MLNQNITVFVPSTNAAQEPNLEAHASYVVAFCRLFATLFGGFTVTEGTGGWLRPGTLELVTEKVALVKSHCDAQTLLAALPKVLEACHGMQQAMGQDCVSLDINGTLYFIYINTTLSALRAAALAA